MLNELFYITPTLSVPEATAPLEELTIEQRALFNFGTIVIDYFEQMLHMDRRHHLPKGILTTWEPWLDECVQAPHFRWVWGRL